MEGEGDEEDGGDDATPNELRMEAAASSERSVAEKTPCMASEESSQVPLKSE